jgi:signal transduction histidine kinase
MEHTSHIADIIDRKQKNLEAIFDAVPIAMLLIDSELIVTRVNDATRKMVKKDYLQIIDNPLGRALGCLDGDDQQHCGGNPLCNQCQFSKILKSALDLQISSHEIEIQTMLMTSDQQTSLWLSVSAEPVSIDEQKYVVLAINDITERKEAEQKLKETMEIKAQFISTVSHELRTPLAAMKESVDIVYEGIAGKINEKQKGFLDIAKRNVQRLGRLINDVLDFQKLGAGKMKCNLVAGNIKAAIKDVCNTMQPAADKEKIKLLINLDDNLPIVDFDYDRMIQILTNLISNAIKFTGQEGTVTVSARQKGVFVSISIADTGLGIPKEELTKIFDQFYRVKRPGKEIQGTGLGLPIVSKLIALHNGRIEVESQLDKGSIFTIYIPLPTEGLCYKS